MPRLRNNAVTIGDKGAAVIYKTPVREGPNRQRPEQPRSREIQVRPERDEFAAADPRQHGTAREQGWRQSQDADVPRAVSKDPARIFFARRSRPAPRAAQLSLRRSDLSGMRPFDGRGRGARSLPRRPCGLAPGRAHGARRRAALSSTTSVVACSSFGPRGSGVRERSIQAAGSGITKVASPSGAASTMVR